MITVACVHAGDYQGCGALYVDRLRSMVARNMAQPYRFVVVEGDANEGWWAKRRLFEPGRFEGRVIYLDLDVLVTGSLDELAAHKGITHLAQWGWAKNDYGSAVMVWDAGEHAEIWERFTPSTPHRFKGDQDYITSLGGWDALPEGMTRSFRYHCKAGPPAGCIVCAFHGPDKPHLLPPEHWAMEYWR